MVFRYVSNVVQLIIPVGHACSEKQLSVADVVAALAPLFEDVTIKKILQHAKFDMHVLSTVGLSLKVSPLTP